jgi:prepilin-type N-terminal cleavage/methylation domain-containing protein
MLFNKKPQKGFTLIEVVVGILIFVIILASIFVFLIPDRDLAKSRDAKRVSELNSLKNALQLYYLDEGEYPTEINWCSIEPGGEPELSHCHNVVEWIHPHFSSAMPEDPLFPTRKGDKIYSYQYKSAFSGQEYKIHAELEKGGFFEVYSMRGNLILYYPSNAVTPESPRLPQVYTHEARSTSGETAGTIVFVGELLSHGNGGVTDQVGFDWFEGGSPLGNVEIPCGVCPLGEFEHIQGGFPVGESCIPYTYQAKARNALTLEWGYGQLMEFYLCP